MLGGFNLKTEDHVEHLSVKHTTRGILQGFPGARRWNGAGGRQAKLLVSRADAAEKSRSVHWMVSREVNLAKLGSRRKNRMLGGPGDYRRLHRVRRVFGKIQGMWSARQMAALPCHKQRLRELDKEGQHLDAEYK